MTGLKILHVANRAERYHANRYYSYAYKMNNGFVRNGHCVYWFSDRDIARANAIIPSRIMGARASNRILLEVCQNFRPDVVVLAHADVISNDTLLSIRRKYDIPIVQYNFDPLHHHNRKILRKRNGFVDINFITTGGSVLKMYANKGTKYAYMPNPVDMSIDKLQNFSNKKLPIDVIFIGQTGNFVDKKDLRTKIPHLSREFPDLNINLSNGVWGNSYFDLLEKAKIGLSFSILVSSENEFDGDGSHHYLYSSDRISQYLGNGLLTIVEKKFCLSEVYGENCLIEIDGFEDLKDKINFFSRRDDLRMKNASNSYKICHEKFNEKLVTQYLLEATLGRPHSSQYSWPTTVWTE